MKRNKSATPLNEKTSDSWTVHWSFQNYPIDLIGDFPFYRMLLQKSKTTT